MKVSFNEIYYTGKEIEYIKDCLKRGHLSGDGEYTHLVSSFLEEKLEVKKVLMITSATHALEIAVMLLNLDRGDEVIMPSFTFPSTANAVLLQGARPVFVEVDKFTLNISPAAVEKVINEKTRAIIPVHYAGLSCNMNKIMDIASKYNLYVIEDAAQALNAKYRGKYLGSYGDMACFSFHGSKNYVSGEGGALAINNLKENFTERAEIIREKGTNRSSFIRGDIDKYTWVDRGSSYLPSDLLMAFLYAQLEQIEEIRQKRKKIFHYYRLALKSFLDNNFLEWMSQVPEENDSNYHLFYLLFKDSIIRNRVMKNLKNKGVNATFHYIPLHLSKMGKKLGYKEGDLPITETASRSLLRLPLYTGMNIEEMKYVVDKTLEVFGEL